MVFCPECDRGDALELAERILARLSSQKMPLARVKLAVTIGIAVHDGANADFSQMYRDAHSALYEARVEGKSSIGLIAPTTAAASQSTREVKSGRAATTRSETPA